MKTIHSKVIALSFLISVTPFAHAWTAITEGHVDLGLGYENGEWDPHIHSSDLGEFGTNEAYLAYGESARTTRPANAAYDFIGVGAGETIWRNYTNNVAGIPWLGFGFEEISAGTFGSYVQTDSRLDPLSAEWVDLQLTGFSSSTGGHVSFFQGGGVSPTVWFATADGLDTTDRFISTVGGHEHGSFVFTKTGVYTLTFQASALDINSGDRIFSDPYTYTFGVEVDAVPEPATMAVLGLGLAAMARRRRK